jgi:putative phosphoserine phosphatase/1-acylglycerol-3-phosphate O-acyltransferase
VSPAPGRPSKGRSVAAYGALAGAFVSGAAVAAVKGDRRAGANRASSLGCDRALRTARVSLRVQGGEHLRSPRPAIFVFNHQSQLDVVILGALLRHDFTGVAKESLRRHPLFGPIGWLTSVAFIDRSDPAAARAALQPVVDSLRSGMSIAVAPEGTRSPTAELLAFKKGPFHMAMQGGVPMVPIVIRNAGELMAAHSAWISPGVVDVCVLPPFDTSGWTVEGIDGHVSEVREAFVRTLADWPTRGA